MEYTLELELYVEAESIEDAVREGEALLNDPARGPFVWSARESRYGPSANEEIYAEDLL